MQFWDKLKERKLVQWALAYIAFGIAVLEVVNAMETPFGLPNGLVRAIMVLVGAGFAVTLVLAWFHGERGHQRMPALEGLLLLVILGAGAAGATVAWRPASSESSARAPSAASGWQAPGARPERNSIAVLPFENLSGDRRDDYFSDGITEELTNSLGELPGLRVAARTSAFQFKAQRPDVREVGGRLGVANVLEGSIQRSGSRVRITARLVDASTGYQLWSGRVDADASDIFAAEDQISKSVATALQGKLALARQPTENARAADPVAHQSYLKARSYARQANPESSRMAQTQYRDAVRRDPGFAPAWAGLGETFLELGRQGLLPERIARDSARFAALRALHLDSSLPQPHMILARVADDLDARIAQARQAVKLNPSSAEARVALAELLAAGGERSAAMIEARAAAALDPLGPRGHDAYRRVMALSGDESEPGSVPTPPLPPGTAAPRGVPRPGEIQGELCAEQAREKALAQVAPKLCEEALRAGANNPEVLANVALGYARLGRRADALEVLQAYEKLPVDPTARSVARAAVYGALGDLDAAFAALGQSEPSRLRAYLGQPRLAPLRLDPRFADLQRKAAG